MGAGRFFITDDWESLKTAFSDAVWNKEVVGKDERLDDGSTDIDSLDAFEYAIERDMKYLIEEVEDGTIWKYVERNKAYVWVYNTENNRWERRSFIK